MTGPHDIAAVSARLAERITELARELAGAEPTSRGGTEWRFGRRGSLAVMVAGPKRGGWFDNEAGCGGDALGLVAHLRHTPMREAFRWALAWLGEAPVHRRPEVARRPVAPPEAPHGASTEAGKDDGKKWSRDLADRLWREAVPPAGTMVEAYLASRGLTLPGDAPLRFHPAAWRNRDNGPPGPAMIACMTVLKTGEPCGAPVTYLRGGGDGAGKAPGERAKIMLGTAGVVRLVPEEEVTLGLGLAEGIETALAVMQGFGWSPVWAATSAGAIRTFPVLPGIEALTVFADADGAGRAAAKACNARWAAAGCQARTIAAPAGQDFNDVLQRWASA